jgi:hypothetical protein
MKIAILDFSTGELFIFPFDNELYDDASDFFESPEAKDYYLTESNCQYMVSNDLKLNII